VSIIDKIIISLILVCVSCGGDSAEPLPVKDQTKYLVVRPIGGLANRLRVLASAHVMAKVSNRKLVLDWKVEPWEMGADFSDLFENKIPTISETEMPEKYKIYGHINGCQVEDVDSIYTDFAEIPSEESQTIYVSTCFNFFPKILSFEDFIREYKSFYSSLSPVESVRLKIAKKSENFEQQENMIGVHYRAWKTSTEDSGDISRILAPLDAFWGKMQQVTLASDQVFFASDDSEAKSFFNTHSSKMLFSDSSNMDRSTVESQQDALVDWYLLTKTRAVIGTYQSSFSEEAALMTLSGRKYNVGPLLEDFHSVICFDSEGLPYKRPPGRKRGC
jgi:hypothetical protein